MTNAAAESTTCHQTVKVVTIPYTNPETHKVEYATHYSPETIRVTSCDTVISYHLVEPTPKGVRFTGMTVTPEHTDQLSAPSISRSGRVMTTVDANTLSTTLNLDLKFDDGKGVCFSDDPEVVNEAPPAM